MNKRSILKPIEEQIIKNLMEFMESDKRNYRAQWTIEKSLTKLAQEEPLGTSSPEFINHPALNAFAAYTANTYDSGIKYFMLWLRIEDYLSNKSDMALRKEKLSQVEKSLKKCLEAVTPKAKARGIAMLPTEVANAQFMRNLYSLNDDNLSNVFLKYLPAPRAKVFEGSDIPEI